MPAAPDNPTDREDLDQGMIEAAAAAWLGFRDRGMDKSETAEFISWLEQDPRHQEVFAELEQVWSGLDRLHVLRPAGAAVSDRDLLAPRRRVRPHRSWLYAGLAAAAAIAVVAVWQSVQAGLPGQVSVATTVGAFETRDLPDGSVVQLNTASAVEINFTATERRVRLVRGEVLFHVAKNPARPFIVSAGPVAVRAVGTAFNVRLRPERVDVLVTEGKVEVNDTVRGASLLAATRSGGAPLLVAGETATISVQPDTGPAAAAVWSVTPLEVERTLAWRERRLEFEGVSLREAVDEFNRYNTHQLVIADPRLEGQRFGGTFRADNYETFVRLLESSFGIRAERTETHTILRRK